MDFTPRVIVITVDAAVAGGKTTLIGRLADELCFPVEICSEPVEAWQRSGLLEEMYAGLEYQRAHPGQPDPNGMPGMFQIYAFSTRLGQFVPAMRRARQRSAAEKTPVILLCERSIWSDRAIFKHMLVAAGHITSVQERVYDGCFEAWELVADTTRPDLAVWLDTAVDDCLVRYHQRARDGETLTRDYATALDARHREVFGAGEFQGAPVLRLDGSAAFHKDRDALQRLAAEINKAVMKL